MTRWKWSRENDKINNRGEKWQDENGGEKWQDGNGGEKITR